MFSTDDKLKNAKSTFFLPACRPYKTYGMGSGLLDVVTQLLMYMTYSRFTLHRFNIKN